MFQPKYRINNKILYNISQIEAAKQIIENSPLLPYYERKFKNEALIRAVHHSTHIEGNRLDIEEAEKIVKGYNPKKSEKTDDFQDIINYRNVLKYIESMQSVNLELNNIFHIHKLISQHLLEEKFCGIFRKQQVVVRNSQTKEISYVPPSFLEMEAMVKDLLLWLTEQTQKEMNSVIKAGLFHCQFVKIHPFVDGNGRTARALTTLLLYIDGYDIKKFFCLDEYYDQNLKSYYQALQSVREFENDYTNWLEYFTNGLLKEFLRVKEKVLKISRDQKIKKSIGQIFLSERQEKIIEFLQEIGRIQNKDFFRIFPGISEDTILRDLKELIKKKVVRKKGRTKAAYYELKD